MTAVVHLAAVGRRVVPASVDDRRRRRAVLALVQEGVEVAAVAGEVVLNAPKQKKKKCIFVRLNLWQKVSHY